MASNWFPPTPACNIARPVWQGRYMYLSNTAHKLILGREALCASASCASGGDIKAGIKAAFDSLECWFADPS
jgi:hypothetical protein